MNLFILEAKRVLKTKNTFILLIIIFLLSIITAYMPISFESCSYIDSKGDTIYLKGIEAIRYKKDIQSIIDGDVTYEKLSSALEAYQNVIGDYGSPESIEFPDNIYLRDILPVKPLLNLLTRTYNGELMDVDVDDINKFYEENKKLLKEKMDDIDSNENSQTQAINMYNNVDKPFKQYSGYSTNSFDYVMIFGFLLVLLCTVIVAPTFSVEYETGADNILRCTKDGRYKLAFTKIIVAFIISIMTYIVCMSIHLVILNFAFGGEAMNTSVQMLFSPISLPHLNLGETLIILVIGGFLSLLATVSCTLYISAKCKTSSTSYIIAIVMCFLPMVLYALFDSNWLASILPTSSVALQGSLFYSLTGWNFLHIGEISIWSPYIIILSATIEIPIFLILAIRAYIKHQVS